ncbi:PREDICTED: uncharacterized protein LOC106740594 [Dinoponera quadriceps]|uniref:Uncharacterized protein LOC106740594 n=1 Tax=Dinoponera quadriceps TaxID=609295 RepID=A0A6P3WND4_DINQU|nr:PREDICTED: uncharacterized protein LOC106740594 [Dinoponera quadriceps]
MILHATDAEFRTNCLDITTKYWFFFGWLDELNAYDNITRITMEAIRITIEYPEDMPCDGFSTLLLNCMRFTQVFAEHPKAECQADRILRVLLNNMYFVLRSTRLTQRWKAYDVLIKELELVMTSKTKFLLAVRVEAREYILRYEKSTKFDTVGGDELRSKLSKFNFPGISLEAYNCYIRNVVMLKPV